MNKITKKDLEEIFQDMSTIKSELKNTILNYEDYGNYYSDNIYQFIIDIGTFYVACNDETEGLDLIIDHLENEELEGWFIDVSIDNNDYIIDTEGNKYYDDEYVTGGNHGKYLYHGGNFRMEKLDI